ncbi:MAG: hypothetical protein ABI692_10205 [Terracoccus sp.]
MSTEQQAGQRVPESKKGKRKKKAAGGVIAGITGVLTIISVGNGVGGNEHPIERTRIAYFVHDRYFPNAVERPEWTRKNLTTEDFQNLPVGKADAWAFWQNVAAVPDDKVNLGPASESKNLYHLSWTWKFKDGSKSTVEVEAGFTCDNWFQRYVPFVQCGRDNVRLNDSRRV